MIHVMSMSHTLSITIHVASMCLMYVCMCAYVRVDALAKVYYVLNSVPGADITHEERCGGKKLSSAQSSHTQISHTRPRYSSLVSVHDDLPCQPAANSDNV